MADESSIHDAPNSSITDEEPTEGTKPTPELRHLFGRQVKSVKNFMTTKFEDEIKKYLNVMRGDIESILPARIQNFDNVDVNVVYPVIKTLIPSLYFQDPQVYIKAEQEKIVIETKNPDTGEVLPNGVQEYDGIQAASKFQAKLNDNIKKAKLKREMKSALTDAELMYYGAIQSGWGNEQGVESMGEGAPPSHRDDTDMDMAYGIRLKPWRVFVDMNDFYHPQWIAVEYEDHPERLKQDKRLENTDDLKGNCEYTDDYKKELWKDVDAKDLKRTQYYALYYKPCAQYPEGIYCLFTEEVPDKFLYFGPWPYSRQETTRTFPIKIIYFNEDPEGGLPIPGIRYYIQQQRAKSVLRRTTYEYIQRTLPLLGVDTTKLDDKGRQAIESGRIPRIIGTKGNPNTITAAISFANLNADFTNFDLTLDDDIDRMVGVADSGGRGANVKFAEVAKQSQANQQVRNSEKADIVRDFMIDIVKHWGALYQEFSPDQMSTTVPGSQFPVDMSYDELQGRFNYDIKPFSMNYEDPTILRRQWVDLLNLGLSPQNIAALQTQSASMDFVKMWKRVLLTYDDPETHSYIIDEASKPEVQVADALNENTALMSRQQVQVLPTDNHQVHIMIHGVLPDVPGKLEHILAHQQAMIAASGGAPQKGGGGNPEGLPITGVASNQEQMQAPLEPSAVNSDIATNREAISPIEVR